MFSTFWGGGGGGKGGGQISSYTGCPFIAQKINVSTAVPVTCFLELPPFLGILCNDLIDWPA